MSYTESSHLQASLKSQKIKRTQHVFCRISYIGTASNSFVYNECHRRECAFLCVWFCSSVNWNLPVGREVRLNSKEPLGMHPFLWWWECTSNQFLWAWSCSSVNWNLSIDRAVRLSSKQPVGMHFFLWWLILYERIRCENLYSWLCRIHVLLSSFFWLFKGRWKSLR